MNRKFKRKKFNIINEQFNASLLNKNIKFFKKKQKKKTYGPQTFEH